MSRRVSGFGPDCMSSNTSRTRRCVPTGCAAMRTCSSGLPFHITLLLRLSVPKMNSKPTFRAVQVFPGQTAIFRQSPSVGVIKPRTRLRKEALAT